MRSGTKILSRHYVSVFFSFFDFVLFFSFSCYVAFFLLFRSYFFFALVFDRNRAWRLMIKTGQIINFCLILFDFA